MLKTDRDDAAPAAATPQDGLPNPRRTLAFITTSIAIMMAVLDGAIVNVALPIIAAEQNVSMVDAVWVITTYQLAVVISLLPMSALGEAIGFRRVYLAGLALFVVASLLCAYSPNIVMLAAVRAVQGIGAGALMSVNGALVRFIMPARKLGAGISGVALVVAISSAAGPTIAAGILAISSWHWLFLINIPLGVIVLIVGQFTLPANPTNGQKFDMLSAILNALALGFLITGLSSIGGATTWPWIAAQLSVAVIAGFFLVRRQLERTAPMFPIDLLKIPLFRQSVMASICAFTAQFLALVCLPFFFHDMIGRNEVQTGLLLTPWPIATAILAPISGRLSDRINPDWLCGAGAAIFALGLVLTGFLHTGSSDLDIMWRLAICGIGFGLFQSPNNRVMITSAPRVRSGGASGMQSTARVLGQSIGAALVGILVGTLGQFNLMALLLTSAGFAVVAAVFSLLRNNLRVEVHA